MSVSVVIPVRNKGSTIARAIVSVTRQNPDEIVVVDDASTDDTADIVQQLAAEHACVRLVRRLEKTADWQESAATVYSTLKGTHVVCMGGDDALTDGMIDSVRRYPTMAVVFHDYWIAGTDDIISGGVSNGFDTPTALTPEDMQERIRTYPYASETGIGSGIRKDLLLWLAGRKFWLMGPWSDAIGYAVVAALHGCVFVPGSGAVFTVNPAGYGATGRDGPDAARYHQAVREFVNGVDLPADVRRLVCEKRGVPYG